MSILMVWLEYIFRPFLLFIMNIEKSYFIASQLVKLHGEELVEVILFPVVNEACRILAEGIAVKASDLDIASVIGLGFPSYRF